MVLVNGKKFKIYELDTLETFQNRLAASLGILSEYLYFPNGITNEEIRDRKNNIEYKNLLKEIKDSARRNTSITELIEKMKVKITGRMSIRDEVVHIWMAYNNILNSEYKSAGKMALYEISDELVAAGIYISATQVPREWDRRDLYKRYLRESISSRQEEAERTSKLFREYDSIDEAIVYTDLKVEKIDFILMLDLSNISLLEIFNSVILTPLVPMAIAHDLFKIFKDFIPSDEEKWLYTEPESVTLKVSQRQFLGHSSKISNYEDAIIKLDPDGSVSTKITISTEKGNVSREEFIDRTMGVFPHLDVKIKSVEDSSVTGVFYIPMQSFNKYVFAELTMNNPIFSSLINIDDSTKATKKKAGIYIHFYHPSTGNVTATITEKVMIKGDQTMKDEDPDLFPLGGKYIRVRVSKADNVRSVNIFQEMLGKLYMIYDAEFNSIVEYYRYYIPDFGTVVEEVEEKVVLRHKDVAPDLYISGYTRKCKNERMPEIISEEEAIKLNAEGTQVMKFPRDVPDDAKSLRFPMDGEEQLYYACKNKSFIYPGIRKNKLKNADIYPYVPCCYKKDQRNKEIYLHYYEGKEPADKKDKTTDIIRTNKFLGYAKFGKLPANIEKLFTFIYPDPKYEYVRTGVFRNEHSFLNCVMEALNDETGILDVKDQDERESVLIDVRNRLARKSIVALGRQEMYDRTSSQIIDDLKNPNTYLDPNLFIHILEDYFECNIFLFSKKVLDGEMTLPRHLQAYYKNRNNNRCIYIFEHMGSESDHAKYPQCELIVRFDTKSGKTEYSFSYMEAKNIRNVYSRIRKSYALDKRILESYLPIPRDIKVKSQWIDSYGKTRRINILFNKHNISLITSPLQPIRVKETNNQTIHKPPLDIVLELTREMKMRVESQTVDDSVTKEINGVIGNVNVSIPVENSPPVDGLPAKHFGTSFPEEKQSNLDIYNMNKKLARYISEYTLWIYSRFLYNEDIVEITDHNIAEFARRFFSINPEYKYAHVSKTFSLDSPILEDGKIVVNNEETIKRLIYVLRLSAKRSRDSVLQYHTRSEISNYYVDITDFNQYNNQVILYGEDSVEKWINENNVNYALHSEIQIGNNTPYFFSNRLIDAKIYLAQNTSSLSKAMDIAVSWARDAHNVGIYAGESKNMFAFTLYAYRNENNIRKISIRGHPFSQEIKIIGYKIDNQPFYTVLLSN